MDSLAHAAATRIAAAAIDTLKSIIERLITS
jgi:hypothetical protein